MKKIIITSVLAIAFFAVADQGRATCTPGEVKVNYIDKQTSGNIKVFVEKVSSTGAGKLYWFNLGPTTSGSVGSNARWLASQLSDALNSGSTVWVQGNAASCGSSSPSTAGYGGFLTRVVSYRNR